MKILINENDIRYIWEYAEFFVKNYPCKKCYFSNDVCCGCEEESDFRSNEKELKGYELCKEDKLKDIFNLYKIVVEKRIAFEKIGKELVKAEDAYNEVISRFEVIRE